MKKNTIYLLAAGVGAYFLYQKSKSDKAAVAAAVTGQSAAPKDSETVAGALGAVMTGNSMLEELGSLGATNGYKLRRY